jgi:hypothetical protein
MSEYEHSNDEESQESHDEHIEEHQEVTAALLQDSSLLLAEFLATYRAAIDDERRVFGMVSEVFGLELERSILVRDDLEQIRAGLEEIVTRLGAMQPVSGSTADRAPVSEAIQRYEADQQQRGRLPWNLDLPVPEKDAAPPNPSGA